MLLLALSFHSVFEGLAIGLQNSTSHMMTVFIAVITHKAVMAFSLGLNIAQSDLSVKAFVWSNVLFSLSSPVGVAIGIALSDLPPSLPQEICNGVLQGIAGGTFLYITFFEVLPHELNKPGSRPWKVISTSPVFICISCPSFRFSSSSLVMPPSVAFSSLLIERAQRDPDSYSGLPIDLLP